MSEDPDYNSGVVDSETYPDLGAEPPGDEGEDDENEGDEGEDTDEEESDEARVLRQASEGDEEADESAAAASLLRQNLGEAADEEDDDEAELPPQFAPRPSIFEMLAAGGSNLPDEEDISQPVATAGSTFSAATLAAAAALPVPTAPVGAGGIVAAPGMPPSVLPGIPPLPIPVNTALLAPAAVSLLPAPPAFPLPGGIPAIPAPVVTTVQTATIAAAPVGATAGIDLNRVSGERSKKGVTLYSVEELKEIARNLGISGISKMKKPELADAIKAAMGPSGIPTSGARAAAPTTALAAAGGAPLPIPGITRVALPVPIPGAALPALPVPTTGATLPALPVPTAAPATLPAPVPTAAPASGGLLPGLPPPSFTAPTEPVSKYTSYTEILRPDTNESKANFETRSYIASLISTTLVPILAGNEEVEALPSPESVIALSRYIFDRYWTKVQYDPLTEEMINLVVARTPELAQRLDVYSEY